MPPLTSSIVSPVTAGAVSGYEADDALAALRHPDEGRPMNMGSGL